MACQGCGRESETRLCCPTCIELGQTSFFCNQECFAKNWAAHSQFHEGVRKKKAEEAAAARMASRQAQVKESASYPRGMGAPLPGGMPLVSSFGASQKRATTGAAKKSDDGVANPPASGQGMLGSFFDQAKAMLSGSETSAVRGQDGQANRPRLRERSPAPAAGAKGPQATLQKPRPAFSLQTGLVAVLIFAVLGGGLLYVQHQRFAEEAAAGGQAALTAAAAAAVSLEGAPREETLVVAAEEAPGPRGNGAATSPPVSADLRAELAALRETVEKHEKMLRYVMDRYVEKDLRTAPQPQQGGVQASVVNASQAGATAAAEVKSEARAGDAPRKRKAGGDTSMVGMPQPEATAEASASSD
ncbi:METAP1 [Symbiodinium natans]|uniref:METAP1 protein n=1 Tax=Symbiodinium natans TaxID=878477 RepID=A0A812LIZ9_9DINO|nr:METAP1 [Symbiodinium natans]